ncbi:hypothetical protein ACVW0J_007726 [Bradyrhizobium sp. i1.7.7]
MTSATLRHSVWILRGNPLTAVAAAGVALFVLIAIFGPWIVPYDPVVSNVSEALLPPSAAHLAGTDQLGRDVFSRLIIAARLDLAIAVSAVGISFVIGAVVGAFCGYAGGKLDRGVGRFVDVMMAFPLFVLAMAMVAALGNRIENIVIATAIINLPFYIRFARAEVNVRRNVGWVEGPRVPAGRAISRWCCASCCRISCRRWRCRSRSISAGPFSTRPACPSSASASSRRRRNGASWSRRARASSRPGDGGWWPFRASR